MLPFLLLHTVADLKVFLFVILLLFTKKSRGFGRVLRTAIAVRAEECSLRCVVDDSWLVFLEAVRAHRYLDFREMHIR